MAKFKKRESIDIQFEKGRRREHAADADAVGAQMVAVSTLAKTLLSDFKKNKDFLVNARPLRRGSLIIPIEITILDVDDILFADDLFSRICILLREFFDLRIRFATEEFALDEGNRISFGGEVVTVDPIVLQAALPTSRESRLFDTAFQFATADPTIQAVTIRSPKFAEPLASIVKGDFSKFSTSSSVSATEKTRTVSSREILVVRSASFDLQLQWHFVWEGRNISASLQSPAFFSDVLSRREIFGSGDVLVVELTRIQQLDVSIGAYVDRRFSVTAVYEHNEAIQTGNLFPES